MIILQDAFIEQVYKTITGALLEEYRVPGAEDLFAPGRPCCTYYSEMLEAYERLRDRLCVTDEDPDAEIMINALLAICREVGFEMYRCGALFRHP